MTTTLKKRIKMPEKIIDYTYGRKPNKNQEIATLCVEGSEIGYKVIANKPKPVKPLTPAEKRAIKESERVMGMLGWDMLFGKGQGPGYYFH